MQAWLLVAALPLMAQKPDLYNMPVRVPRLASPPRIDADLADWKDRAFTDGVWDLARLRQMPWYDPARDFELP